MTRSVFCNYVSVDSDIEKIQRLSNNSLSTPMRLFTPYWRTIAITVVQDLQRRPQVAQQMSDLLAMTVTDFLRLTQYHTTPYLVLTKKRDILQRVADACGRSIKDQCMDHNNLAAVLAYILLQPSKDTEDMIMGLLRAASSEFDHVDCAELVKGEPMLTASELLKAAGEDDDLKKSRVSHDFILFPNHLIPDSIGQSSAQLYCWHYAWQNRARPGNSSKD